MDNDNNLFRSAFPSISSLVPNLFTRRTIGNSSSIICYRIPTQIDEIPNFSHSTQDFAPAILNYRPPTTSMTGSGLPSIEGVFSAVPAFKKTRLPSLYSDFSHLVDSNPEGYDANIQAWNDVFKQCLVQNVFGSSITLPGAELAAKFANRELGEPKGLSLVLAKQILRNSMVPWSIYRFTSPNVAMSARDYISPAKWFEKGYGLVKYWGFSPKDRLGRLVAENYIAWERLVDIGDEVSTKLQLKVTREGIYTAKLFDNDLFAETVSSLVPGLSDLDVQVLIIYLSRDIGVVSVARDSESGIQYVKIENTPISDQDIGIINLKKYVSNLRKRTEVLENRLDVEIPREIERLLNVKGLEDRIKSVLVRKAVLKKSLAKSLGVLDQLSGILEKINEADTNVLLFETMKGAKDVLSVYNSKLSLEEVDNLQSELDDQVERTNELSAAMAPVFDVDDYEIDEEFARLEKEHEESIKKEDALDQLSLEKDLDKSTNEESPNETELAERLKYLKLDSKQISEASERNEEPVPA